MEGWVVERGWGGEMGGGKREKDGHVEDWMEKQKHVQMQEEDGEMNR